MAISRTDPNQNIEQSIAMINNHIAGITTSFATANHFHELETIISIILDMQTLDHPLEFLNRLLLMRHQGISQSSLQRLQNELLKLINVVLDICFFTQEKFASTKELPKHIDFLIRNEILIAQKCLHICDRLQKLTAFKNKDSLQKTCGLLTDVLLFKFQGPFGELAERRKKKLQSIYHCINAIPGNHYLSGGAVIELLNNNIDNAYDFDFVSPCENRHAIDKNLLHRLDFRKSRNPQTPNLYTNRQKFKIDLNFITEDAKWMFTDAFLRDFSICSMYADKEGHVYDPTGFGLPDLKNKILRMNGCKTVINAIKRFCHNPTYILRALKYQLKGFTPDPILETALNEFDNEKSIAANKDYLYAVTRKLCYTLNEQEQNDFMNLFVKYNLLNKIYGLDKQANLDDVKKEVGLNNQETNSYSHNSSPLGF